MSFLPDPSDLDAIASRINAHASATRARAVRLGTAVAATGWQGVAATVFDEQAHLALGALRCSAGRLDTAAEALRRHAQRLSLLYDDLRDVGGEGLRLFGDSLAHPERLLSDAQHLLSDGAGLAGDALSLIGIG